MADACFVSVKCHQLSREECEIKNEVVFVPIVLIVF